MPIVRCDRCHEGTYLPLGGNQSPTCAQCQAPVDPWAPRISGRDRRGGAGCFWTVRVSYADADLIEVGGPLTSLGVGKLMRSLEASMGRSAVIVNLAYCDFIDRAGVDLLRSAPGILEPSGTRFALAGVHGRVERILGFAAIRTKVEVFRDGAAALRGLSQAAGA